MTVAGLQHRSERGSPELCGQGHSGAAETGSKGHYRQLLLGYKQSVSFKSSFLPSCFSDLLRHTPSLNSFHVGAGLSSMPLFPCSFELISSGLFYHTLLSSTPPHLHLHSHPYPDAYTSKTTVYSTPCPGLGISHH